MTRKIRITICDESGVVLDMGTLEIPSNHTIVHIITTKPDGVVIGAESELCIGK